MRAGLWSRCRAGAWGLVGGPLAARGRAGVVTGYLDICDARYRELGKSKIVFNGDVIFL